MRDVSALVGEDVSVIPRKRALELLEVHFKRVASGCDVDSDELSRKIMNILRMIKQDKENTKFYKAILANILMPVGLSTQQ